MAAGTTVLKLSGIVISIFSQLTGPASAESLTAKNDFAPPFHALCKDIEVQSFRDDTLLKPEWSTGEKFFTPWSFSYLGGNVIIVNGDELPILENRNNLLIAVGSGSNQIAVSLWAYAINIKMKSVVAAQVQASSDSLSAGVKTRAVELECKWYEDLSVE